MESAYAGLYEERSISFITSNYTTFQTSCSPLHPPSSECSTLLHLGAGSVLIWSFISSILSSWWQADFHVLVKIICIFCLLKAFVVVCMRNVPNGLTCLNSWSQLLVLSGQVTGGAGWLEEVSHWEQALSVYSLDPFFAFPWLPVRVVEMPSLSFALLPCLSWHYGHLSLWNPKSLSCFWS